MTVSTTESEVSYTSGGPGFPIPFRFLRNEDIQAMILDPAGVTEQLTAAQFSLSGAGAQQGGTLTSTYAASQLAKTGYTLSIYRNMIATQPTDLRNQGAYFAETHEMVFDRLTMLTQQNSSRQDRALVRPIGKSFYDAQNRQIKNLADPTAGQDAATMNWARSYLATAISQIQGPINNASNVFYLGPDGLNYVAQDLSSATVPTKGAALVGYRGRTVAARLGDMPSVKDYGCKGDGITNDKVNFQAAINANAGSSLYVPPGVYMVDSTLFIPSNTTLFGAGASSRIKATAGFIMLNVPWAGGTLPILLGNEGIVTSEAATRIEIYNLYCDSSLTSNGVHNIHMRNVNQCTVYNCTFNGGADGTAFTKSTNWKVSNCFAFGQTNCCYDSWEGSSYGLYENNIGYLTLGYGMLCTGDTSLNTVGTSGNISFIGNTIVGPFNSNGSIGIWLQSGSNLTSNCFSCIAANNNISGFLVGIRATGGGQHIISDNRIDNCPTQGIGLSAEVPGNPTTNNAINGNVLNNSGNIGGAGIVINEGASSNALNGNKVGNVTSDYTVTIAANCNDNVFSGNNFAKGNVGYVLDAGLRNEVGNTRSGFHEQGSFVPTLTTTGGGTPTYTAQYGNYQVLGKFCYFSGRVAISALGTLAAGNVQILGLPKMASSVSVNNQPPVQMSTSNASGALAVPPVGRLPSGTTRIDVYKWASGSIAPLVLTDITATYETTFSGRYLIAG